MAETYEHHAAGLESPALHAFDVLPDDVIPLPPPPRVPSAMPAIFASPCFQGRR